MATAPIACASTLCNPRLLYSAAHPLPGPIWQRTAMGSGFGVDKASAWFLAASQALGRLIWTAESRKRFPVLGRDYSRVTVFTQKGMPT